VASSPQCDLIWLLGGSVQIQLDSGRDGGSALARNDVPDIIRSIYDTAGASVLQCFFIGFAFVLKDERSRVIARCSAFWTFAGPPSASTSR
jgi:hypothetical protein